MPSSVYSLSSSPGKQDPGPYSGHRTTHQLRETAESTLIVNGTINELVNYSLGYLENFHTNLKNNMLEAAYINYWHAYLIITRCIPDHPDYGKFSSKITSPFYETYVDLIELITRDPKVNELEEMINDRAAKSKAAMNTTSAATSPASKPTTTNGTTTSTTQSSQYSVARKPVSSTSGISSSNNNANESKDDLTARFERLRGPGPKGPRPSPTSNSITTNGKMVSTETNGYRKSIPSSGSNNLPPPPSFPPPQPPQLQRQQEKSSPILFPKTTVINAETLLHYLERTPESVLVLDLRSRQEFDQGHITAPNVVCIEPITLRPNMNDQDLEDALILNPDSEQRSFAKRDSYEIIVYYDAHSTTYNDKTASNSTNLQNLLHAIYQRAFSKKLKRPPCILAGGFDTWLDDFSGKHITVSSSISYQYEHSYKAHPKQHPASITPAPPKNNNTTTSANTTTVAPYPVSPSHPPHSHSHSQEYIKDISGYFKAPAQVQHYQHQQQQIQPPTQYYNKHGSSSVPSTPPHLPVNGYRQHPAPNYSTKPTSNSSISSTQGTDVILTQSNQLRMVALEFTTGLQNLGNTCYMNCIVQCLAGTPTLSISLADESYKRYVNVNSRLGYKGMLVQKFAELVQTMFKGNVAYVGPTALKDLSGRLRDTFRGSEQQDCQEFLTFILDGLHEDLNINGDKERLKQLTEAEERKREGMSFRLASTIEWERYLKSDYSPIVETMQGQYQSRLKCLTCGNTSTTYNVFSFLSLPIPLNHQTVSLKDCFDLFTQDEILDNDNAWHCPKCKTRRRAVKTLTISRLPQVLIIHLKRFQQKVSGTNKLETFVTYPTNNLDLTDYWLNNSSNNGPPSNNSDESKLAKLPKRGQSPPFQYDLYAVANHFGTLKGGHYTSFVRKGTKGWCYFDDVRVTGSVGQEYIVNQHAYVLFYQRRMRE